MTKELALVLGKKKAKEIQNVLNKLLKREIIKKTKVNNKLQWSLVEINECNDESIIINELTDEVLPVKDMVSELLYKKDVSAQTVDNESCYINNDILDLIKECIVQKEKEKEDLIFNLLTEQIMDLKKEIVHKNEVIKHLLDQIRISGTGSAELLPTSSPINSIVNANENVNQPLALNEWKQVGVMNGVKSHKEKKSINVPPVSTSNFYRPLFVEDYSNFDEVENNVSQHDCYYGKPVAENVNNTVKKRPHVIVQVNPERNVLNIDSRPKLRQGNSSYSNITKSGPSTLVLSDSICKRIRVKEFNKFIHNGYTKFVSINGLNTKRLLHHCDFYLREYKPDNVIINIGTNNLQIDDIYEINKNIIEIVQRCQEYGANRIIVSEITFRREFEPKIKQINELLHENKLRYNYEVIDNSRIEGKHLYDMVHLNNEGLTILANNFIGVLNSKCSL